MASSSLPHNRLLTGTPPSSEPVAVPRRVATSSSPQLASSPLSGSHASLRSSSGARGRIALNVGGKVFVTTHETLGKYPDSLLDMYYFFSDVIRGRERQPYFQAFRSFHLLYQRRMFDERNISLVQTGSDGAVFFDRNPSLFEAVLEFYRTGHFIFDTEKMPYSVEALKSEFDFWGLLHPFIEEASSENALFAVKVAEKSLDVRRQAPDQPLYKLLLSETKKAIENAASQGRAFILIHFTSKGQTYFGGSAFGVDEYVIMNVIIKDFFHNPSNRLLFLKDLKDLGMRASKRGVHRPKDGPGYGAEWRLELLIWNCLTLEDFEEMELYKPQAIPIR